MRAGFNHVHTLMYARLASIFACHVMIHIRLYKLVTEWCCTLSWLPRANLTLRPVFFTPNICTVAILCMCTYADSLAEHIKFCTDKCYKCSENVQCLTVISSTDCVDNAENANRKKLVTYIVIKITKQV